MAIDDTTRKINILQPLSTLISVLSTSRAFESTLKDITSSIDTKGRLIVTDLDEITYLSLYWDRIDEALFVDIEKEAADGKGFDETNEYDKKTHRIYPSFVAGAPTVAAQFEIQKLGYKATELPVGNSMTATFSSLSTLELEFTNKVIVSSFKTITIDALPFGEILSLTSSNVGSGYLSSSDYIDGLQVGDYTLSGGSGSNAAVTVVATPTGEIDSVELATGGENYEVGNILTILGGGSNATVEVLSTVTTNGVAASLPVIEVTADEPKSNTVTVSLSTSATYSTTYRVTAPRVLNLAKESSSLIALTTTETATPPCPAITSILFEAYGSGEQTILPRTLAQYNATHSNTQFLYYETGGISWAEFITQSEFTGANPPIEVPESVTPPTTVYAYYRDGAYLLPDSSWIVGIIGSETDYEGNYEYVLYTLDNILNYKQLTTAGSSTAPCGTSDWGGDWGASIQQFAINR